MTRVHIIGTGGTIASRSESTGRCRPADAHTGAVASVSIDDIVNSASVPSSIEVTAQDVLMTGSYSLGMSEIRQIVSEILASVEDPEIDGVVVTHGTDTMEETAFLTELARWFHHLRGHELSLTRKR